MLGADSGCQPWIPCGCIRWEWNIEVFVVLILLPDLASFIHQAEFMHPTQGTWFRSSDLYCVQINISRWLHACMDACRMFSFFAWSKNCTWRQIVQVHKAISGGDRTCKSFLLTWGWLPPAGGCQRSLKGHGMINRGIYPQPLSTAIDHHYIINIIMNYIIITN